MPVSLVAMTITLAPYSAIRSVVSGRSGAMELMIGLPARPSYAASPSAMRSELEESMLGGIGEAACTVSTVHLMQRFWMSRS